MSHVKHPFGWDSIGHAPDRFGNTSRSSFYESSSAGTDLQGAYNSSPAVVLDAATPITIESAGSTETYVSYTKAATEVIKLDNDGLIEAVTLNTDTINEKTLAAGITIDSVLLRDNEVTANEIFCDNLSSAGTQATLVFDTGNATFQNALTVTGNITANGNIIGDNATTITQMASISVVGATASTSNASGDLIVAGGAGVAQDVRSGGSIVAEHEVSAVNEGGFGSVSMSAGGGLYYKTTLPDGFSTRAGNSLVTGTVSFVRNSEYSSDSASLGKKPNSLYFNRHMPDANTKFVNTIQEGDGTNVLVGFACATIGGYSGSMTDASEQTVLTLDHYDDSSSTSTSTTIYNVNHKHQTTDVIPVLMSPITLAGFRDSFEVKVDTSTGTNSYPTHIDMSYIILQLDKTNYSHCRGDFPSPAGSVGFSLTTASDGVTKGLLTSDQYNNGAFTEPTSNDVKWTCPVSGTSIWLYGFTVNGYTIADTGDSERVLVICDHTINSSTTATTECIDENVSTKPLYGSTGNWCGIIQCLTNADTFEAQLHSAVSNTKYPNYISNYAIRLDNITGVDYLCFKRLQTNTYSDVREFADSVSSDLVTYGMWNANAYHETLQGTLSGASTRWSAGRWTCPLTGCYMYFADVGQFSESTADSTQYKVNLNVISPDGNTTTTTPLLALSADQSIADNKSTFGGIYYFELGSVVYLTQENKWGRNANVSIAGPFK